MSIYFSVATLIKESNGRGENTVIYVDFFIRIEKLKNTHNILITCLK